VIFIEIGSFVRLDRLCCWRVTAYLDMRPPRAADPMRIPNELAAAAAVRPLVRLDEVLDALNAPQKRVATRGEGPLLVVAGPGAGKTRAIIARVTYLLLARGVAPGEITAITFSRRAAGELQARLAALLGERLPAKETVWAGTFHALGARILRHGGAHLFGRPRNFTIYDQDDTERSLRRILGVLGVPPNHHGRLSAAGRQAISLCKRSGAPGEGEVGEGAEAVALSELMLRYEDELRDSGAFDFDDLVVVTAEALERDAALRAWAQRQTRHLLVDEYQDTDPAQEGFIRRLSPPPHDLCVVADPQQSIYAFRGAAPEGVQRFMQRWPQATVVRLEQNYRSTKSIVAVARRLVAPYARSLGSLNLKLWTENPAGLPARLWVAPHPEKEANAIAQDVAAKLAAGWPAEEIAILVRTHAQARPIEAALLRAGLPYVLVGGVRFYAREEIKDALAYLRLAVLAEDAASFWRIVNTPRRGLGPAALLSIARHALDGGGPVAGARRWAATEDAPDGLYDLLAHLDELTSMVRTGAGPKIVLEAALRLTRYREYVVRQHRDDAQLRLEALAELLGIAAAYEDPRQFLDDAVLSAEEEDGASLSQAPTQGRVRLATVHASKGLEFRAVYVPGCELGLFPLTSRKGSAAQDEAADPEERRVFYVAVTRAKEELTLSYCTFRRDGRTQPSPFLADIGRGLLQRAKLGSDEPAPRRVKRKPASTPRPTGSE
jgi:DNA helicase-2/ATP-dependent DNA helicase PcrA